MEADAKRFAKAKQAEVEHHGIAWLSVPAAERAGLLQARERARAGGYDLLSALTEWEKGRTPIATAVSLRSAVEECLKSKESQNLRAAYLRPLRGELGFFLTGREEVSVAEITAAQIEEWLNSRGYAPAPEGATELICKRCFRSASGADGSVLTRPAPCLRRFWTTERRAS